MKVLSFLEFLKESEEAETPIDSIEPIEDDAEGETNEDLRAWFGKGKKGGYGGGGWDRYSTTGERIGKCGDADEGDPYPVCMSREMAEKLGKKGIAAYVKKKRAAKKKGGDSKKGLERSKGQSPIWTKIKIDESFSKKYNTEFYVIDGADFKREYLTTNSGYLEKAYFENSGDTDSMGNVLGNGEYFSVTQESSEHYENDDYYIETNYYELSDSAKILIMTSSDEFSSEEIEAIARKYRVDGLYNSNEGKDGTPFLGLVIYNSNVIIDESISNSYNRFNLIVEKNVPTDKKKWAYYIAQAKKKFDVYPSVYANAWAAKMYKKAGGGWRKIEK